MLRPPFIFCKLQDSIVTSPSPWPSPLGRGRSVSNFLKKRRALILRTVCARCSLSPRERAGVRGKSLSAQTITQGLRCARRLQTLLFHVRKRMRKILSVLALWLGPAFLAFSQPNQPVIVPPQRDP